MGEENMNSMYEVVIITPILVVCIVYWPIEFHRLMYLERTKIITDASDVAPSRWRIFLVVLIALVVTGLALYLSFPKAHVFFLIPVAGAICILPGWLIGGLWHLWAVNPTTRIDWRPFLWWLSLLAWATYLGLRQGLPLLQQLH